MRWIDVRTVYPEQWLVIEALQAHSENEVRFLDRIAVIETCADGQAAFESYRRLHQEYPQREFYFVNTRREKLDIRERRWLGIRVSNQVMETLQIEWHAVCPR